MDAGNLFALLAISIPLVAILSSSLKKWMALKEKQLEAASTQSAEKAAQYAAKTERLEQRVAVLERILTDRSANLAEDIERLRETPLN